MIEQLWLQIGPVFSHIPVHLVSEGAEAHEKIIAALQAGDAEATRAAVVADLNMGGARIAAVLSESGNT